MKLDFEKFLNENGLKVGDKVKILSNGLVYEIAKDTNDNVLCLKNVMTNIFGTINLLQYGIEKLEPKKKVGDLLCKNVECEKCPLCCIACDVHANDTLRETFEENLKKYPQLEQMRTYIEKELDKEIEEDGKI